MSNYTVNFNSVGRARATWSVDFAKRPDEMDIARAVQKKKCLASRFVDVEFINDDETEGDISAGFRTVGTFKVVANQ